MHFLFALLMAIANDPRTALAGTWRGDSICTEPRGACHDEIAVYHITVPEKAGVVDLVANKVINGKEVEMGGTLRFNVDADATTLTSEITFNGHHLAWNFKRKGNDIRGTLAELPANRIVRNIHVEKQKAEGRKQK